MLGAGHNFETRRCVQNSMARWKITYLEPTEEPDNIEADSLWLPGNEKGFVVFHEGATRPDPTSDKITFIVLARLVRNIEKV